MTNDLSLLKGVVLNFKGFCRRIFRVKNLGIFTRLKHFIPKRRKSVYKTFIRVRDFHFRRLPAILIIRGVYETKAGYVFRSAFLARFSIRRAARESAAASGAVRPRPLRDRA